MSTTPQPDSDDAQPAEQPPEPACGSPLSDTSSTEWKRRPAEVYPPGYPALCSHPECFGDELDENAVYAEDYDHAEELDELVVSTGSANTAKRYHVPQREADDE